MLALCDLSSSEATLEIKSTSVYNVSTIADQLFYEANGRKCYVLQTDWTFFPGKITYNINEVSFIVKSPDDARIERLEKAKKDIETDLVELLSFKTQTKPVTLRCKACGLEWTSSYYVAAKHRPCPNCATTINPKTRKAKPKLSEEERKTKKLASFKGKLDERSGHLIEALDFTDSRSAAKVRCLKCGYEWSSRADHILDRPYCPQCRHR